MASFLLIETRDPFESADVGFIHDQAKRLTAAGHHVSLFLVQNGVLPARAGVTTQDFAELRQAGVEILADEFSLRERGIPDDRVYSGVQPCGLGVVVDRLAEGAKVIWHQETTWPREGC
jgi:predicted peroxiredoxin